MASVAEVFGQAWQYHQAGSFPQAEQLYRQVLQVQPANADAWCFLAAVCQAQGRLAEAVSDFRQALQVLPSHPMRQKLPGHRPGSAGQFGRRRRLLRGTGSHPTRGCGGLQ